MFNLQPFLDLINSKYCTHEYNILNFSDLEKVDKTFFKNTKYQSEKKHIFLAKEFWSQCHILRIIYVLYMYYMCIICVFAGFCWLFLGFLRPRVFLSVLLLAFAGFSWVLTKGIVDEDVEHHRSTKQPAKFSPRGGPPGGTPARGPPGGPQDDLNPKWGEKKGGTRYNLTAC